MALKDDVMEMLNIEEQEDALVDKITVLALKLYKTRMRLVGAGGRPSESFQDLMEFAATLEAEGEEG